MIAIRPHRRAFLRQGPRWRFAIEFLRKQHLDRRLARMSHALNQQGRLIFGIESAETGEMM